MINSYEQRVDMCFDQLKDKGDNLTQHGFLKETAVAVNKGNDYDVVGPVFSKMPLENPTVQIHPRQSWALGPTPQN